MLAMHSGKMYMPPFFLYIYGQLQLPEKYKYDCTTGPGTGILQHS